MAFLIIAHDGQTVAYLSRLIGVLNKPGHFVMVHVDAKARRELHDLVKGLEGEQSADYGTVRLVTPAVQVSWAGPSMLHAMLLGLRQLDELSSLWGHVIVISGSDFPVKPVDHMAKLLRSFGPSSHFEMFLQLPEFARARGLDLPWVECENFVYKVHSSRPQIEVPVPLPLKMLGIPGQKLHLYASRVSKSVHCVCHLLPSVRSPRVRAGNRRVGGQLMDNSLALFHQVPRLVPLRPVHERP